MSDPKDTIGSALCAIPTPLRRLAYVFTFLWLSLQIVGCLLAFAVLSGFVFAICKAALALAK